MIELPEGWIETSFMEVFDIQGGTQPPKAQFKFEPQDGYIRLLQIRDFGDRPVPTYIPNKSGLKICGKDDILIGRYGASVGRICTGMEGAYNVALAKAIIPKEIDKRFVFYLLQADLFQKPILATERSAQDGFNKDDLERINIPLIPLAEQRRIVAKLEILLGKVEACQQRLAKIPVILKRFRQAVLAAACSGELTVDWREKNPDIKPATEILNQMSVVPLQQNEWPDNEIPSAWVWVRFGDVIAELRNGVSIRPNMEPPGTPILRISAARPGKVDLDDNRFLPTGEGFLPQYSLKDGDLLFTRYNGSLELLGVCGMVRGLENQPLLYPDKLMRVRFDSEQILPEYTEIFFQVSSVHERIIAKSKSSAGQNGVSQEQI